MQGAILPMATGTSKPPPPPPPAPDAPTTPRQHINDDHQHPDHDYHHQHHHHHHRHRHRHHRHHHRCAIIITTTTIIIFTIIIIKAVRIKWQLLPRGHYITQDPLAQHQDPKKSDCSCSMSSSVRRIQICACPVLCLLTCTTRKDALTSLAACSLVARKLRDVLDFYTEPFSASPQTACDHWMNYGYGDGHRSTRETSKVHTMRLSENVLALSADSANA